MDVAMKEWEHVFKLDPAKAISDDDLDKICRSGTDAIIVGGTDQITEENVYRLLMRLTAYELPIVLEISSMQAIVYGFDYYFVPMVMNSKDKKWFMDIQHEAIKEFHPFIDWDKMFVEGYCILNKEAKAFEKANCKISGEEDLTAYASMAEQLFKFPIFYIEYSGAYGDVEMVKSAKYKLLNTLLFYGGGIRTAEQAREMKQYADVIVVGNVIYENIEAALQTVGAVKQFEMT